MEKEPKEFEIGLDAQKRFAQMHEDGNVNKGIGGQVMKLDPVIAQESKKNKEQENPNPCSR